MSDARVIPMTALLGRDVRDASGRSIGKIQELIAEVVLLPHGAEYVVTRIAVGRFRPLDTILTGTFVPPLLQRVCERFGYRRHELPWDAIDFSDPMHPRLVQQT